jgi:membrane protein implicated in regulation of membrane protease activity
VNRPEQLGSGRSPRGSGWLGRIAAALATGVMLVLGVMFSVVVLALAAIAVASVIAWLWWKVRRVRQRTQDPDRAGFRASPRGATSQQPGNVIEGEVLKGEWKQDPNPRH